jgi:NTE family protein
LSSLFDITSQSMTISSDRDITVLLTERDLLLEPDVADFGSLDFSDVPAIIGEGEGEARSHASALAQYTLSEKDYLRHLEGRRPPPAPPDLLTGIEFRGLRSVDERIVRRLIRTEVGQPLDLETLRRDLGRIFGLGAFELVDYELSPRADGWTLAILVTEKRGGPFFMRSALNVRLDGDQRLFASALVNFSGLRLNKLGAEWRNDFKIGSVQGIESEFYQPLDFGQRWFIAPSLAWGRDVLTVYLEDSPLSEFEVVTTLAAVDLGLSLGTLGEIRIGPFRERSRHRLKSGPEIEEVEDEIDVGGWLASVAIDTLNSIFFPRSGQLMAVGVVAARPSLGADDEFDIGGLNYVAVKSAGRHTFLSWIELGSGLGDDPPPYAWFAGGGLFSFSGYEPGELSGVSYGVFRPTYLCRVATLPPIVGKGVYAGAWLEAGNYWQSRDDVGLDDLRYAATLTLGAETIIGPAYLAVGFAEEGRRQIYLTIGASFRGRP